MNPTRLLGVCVLAAFAACDAPSAPETFDEPLFATGPATDLITGSGQIEIAGALRNFAFTAHRAPDGTATGNFELHARQVGNRVHGRVTCATTFGGTAWLGGSITTAGPFEGQDAIWRAADLGAGTKGLPDLISLLGPRAPGTAATFCATTPPSPALIFPVQGNITVLSPRSSSFTAVDVVELVDLPVFVPCADGGAGELVLLSGSLQILFHFNEDPAGGFHVTSEANPQDVSGVGQVTGDIYRGTGGTGGHTNGSISGLPFTDSFVNNFRIIGPGPGNDLLVHQNAQFTVNANGVVTVSIFHSSVECR